MEKNEIDPYRDYFEMMSSEREANMNRQGYKRMKSDFLQEQGNFRIFRDQYLILNKVRTLSFYHLCMLRLNL